MQNIPIIANGTSPLQRTILSNAFQAFATGTWGGATIKIQISAQNPTNGSSSPFLTIATLSESNPIIPSYPVMQGLYMQFVVENATVTTNLVLTTGYLFVMQV